MATSPITIGTFDNVPAPGSPIRSAWAQEISTFVHNSVVRRDIATTQTMPGSLHTSGGSFVSITGNVLAGVAPTDTAIGAMMRADGVVLSTINDPSPLTTANVTLQRTGVGAGVGGFFLKFNRLAGGATIGSVAIVAGPGVAYNTTSDARLKTELGPIADPLDLIGRLRPLTFEWRDPEFAGVEHRGFFAHEVADVEPDAVTGDPDAVDADGNVIPQQLDASKLIPILVAAVQELSARVAELEAA